MKRTAYFGLPAIVFLAQFIAFYAFITCICFPHMYFDILVNEYLPQLFVAMPVLSVLILPIASFSSRSISPIIYIFKTINDKWVDVIAIGVAFVVFMSAFTTLKVVLVKALGFYADPVLADLDELILGADSWRVIHHVVPGFFVNYLIGPCYSVGWLMNFLGTIVYVAFSRPEPERTRYLAALVATWVLVGTVLATIFSSAGPVFFDRVHDASRFGDLMATLHNSGLGRSVLTVADYLYASYSTGSDGLGTGISAFPSMHVGLTVLNALYFTGISRKFGALMWTIAGIVFVGSMYTGFHYATDGIVSAIVVAVIWISTGRIFYGSRNRPDVAPAAIPEPMALETASIADSFE